MVTANTELAEMRTEADAILKSIRFIQNPDLIRRIEADYESLMDRINLQEANRDEKEFTERDLNRAIKWSKHFLEHLDELVMNTENEGLRNMFWSLIFPEPPTYAEITTRTALLSPLVRFKDGSDSGRSALVEPADFDTNQICVELIRWHSLLTLFENMLPNDFRNSS